MSPSLVRSLAAEFLGTALLVIIAVGSAVAGIDSIGEFGVAFAFGLTLLALAYAIGPSRAVTSIRRSRSPCCSRAG